jgi:hypothetical protein
MPRRIPCAHPGCTVRIDAARITGLCVTHYNETLRTPAPPRPEPRWQTRVAQVPQITGADGYQYRPVTLRLEPFPVPK